MKYFKYDYAGKPYGINPVAIRDFMIAVSIWLILGLLALLSNFTPLVWVAKAYMVFIVGLIVVGIIAKKGDK